MKVTVAFGDVKVVVPCGNGEITIRQLSELAVTRYLKSTQQDKKPQKMSVNISAFVLARDFGILDWDDKVVDVVDDRELIISRFVVDVIAATNNYVTNSTSDSNEHRSLSSDFRKTILYTSIVPTKQITVVNTNDCRNKAHRRRSGSFVPGPTNSIESYTYDWNLPSTIQCMNTSTIRKPVEKEKFPSKKRYSVDVTDSSLWSIPPLSFEPIITGHDLHLTVTTTGHDTDNMSHNMSSNITKSNEMNPTSLKYSRYPCSQSLSTDSDNSKKCSQKTKTRKVSLTKPIHTSTPSIRSHSDGKSMPLSYYSSLESTAVSDCNNSSLDEGQPTNVTESSIITNINHIDNDGRQLLARSNEEPTSISFKNDNLPLSEVFSKPSTGVTLSAYVPIITDLTEIPIPSLSVTPKVNSDHKDIRSPFSDIQLQSPDRTSSSSNLQPPPPIPPMRSPSTKLSSNPINVVFQSLKNNHFKSSTNKIDAETIPELKSSQKSELPLLKKFFNLSKPDNTSTTFFDSEFKPGERPENQTTTNERNADLETIPTTMHVSVNQNSETSISALTTKANLIENLVVTLKKSSNGFGFSLTSRQNAVDLTNPVYVSKILENGPAISDGRMKAGDRILMINNEDVRHLSQKEIKEILLNISIDSTVIIGLYRPNSDSISSILVSSNPTALPVKIPLSSVGNTVGDENENNQKTALIEEQKPPKFTMCDCVYSHSVLASQFDMYHFNILHKTVKIDHLSPKFIDRPLSDALPKSPDLKSEPPAIQLHHQNKLSPSSLSGKSTIDTKYSHATLGISVRKGFSQLFFNDYESVRQSESGAKKSSVDDKQSHKLCPNCHGLLSLKHGVFVTAIIPGGAASVDGRLANYDEIISVQGVCLVTGEQFILPNNKVPLGDSYEPLKCAQMSSQFLNRIPTIDSSTSAIDVSTKSDPLDLLKQLLNSAQTTSSSVSLVIMRKSLDKYGIPPVQTSTSTDSNYSHNVTVAADVHTQYSKEKGENFNFVLPNIISSNNSVQIMSIKDRVKQFENIHRKTFYRNEKDELLGHNTSTDLICLDSERESDIEGPVEEIHTSIPDNTNIPTTLGLNSEFQKPFVPIVNIRESSFTENCIDDKVCNAESSNHTLLTSPTSLQSPVQDSSVIYDATDSDSLNPLYFSREDHTRQSFSLRRIHLNPEASSRMSRLSLFKTSKLPTNVRRVEIRHPGGFRRPKSEVILSRVDEEESSSDVGQLTDFDEQTRTIDRRVMLRRRAVITRKQSRKSIL